MAQDLKVSTQTNNYENENKYFMCHDSFRSGIQLCSEK